MDYDALKDQWSEVEDRDGIRLSWNTFPSTRMVSIVFTDFPDTADPCEGSFSASCTYWSFVHTTKREAGHSCSQIRARDLQTAVPSCLKPICVCLLSKGCTIF